MAKFKVGRILRIKVHTALQARISIKEELIGLHVIMSQRSVTIKTPIIQIREKDLLITKDGSIGKVALVDHLPGPACLNSGIFVTRPKTNNYTSDFLYWVLPVHQFSQAS